MLRVGMMGADSTHTELYARLMNLPDGPFYGRAQVVKLWGADPAEARQKADVCHIPEVVSDVAAPVHWADADLDALAGRPLRLRFRVQAARLFAFRFE